MGAGAAQFRARIRADLPVAARAAHLEAGPAAGAGGIAVGDLVEYVAGLVTDEVDVQEMHGAAVARHLHGRRALLEIAVTMRLESRPPSR
jgi:hypothetical protein